ncbi:beta-ketoacyl synthase N-terminal-like domain-containing protein [Micromonospora sp. BRA006-A]|nr:beta-ketoacyl synthase N-terminal-like domain-containing protein [Micromonospora sp. BRA006-A]
MAQDGPARCAPRPRRAPAVGPARPGPGAPAPRRAVRPAETAALTGRLAGLDREERAAALLRLVLDQIATVLGYADAAAVEAGRPFTSSVSTAHRRRTAQPALGAVPAPRDAGLRPPDPAHALADHLDTNRNGRRHPGRLREYPRRDSTSRSRSIGTSPTLAARPSNCGISPRLCLPVATWHHRLPRRPWLGRRRPVTVRRAGQQLRPRGGFLADAADFDADLFKISPHEALAMDPQRRLLLGDLVGGHRGRRIDPLALRGRPVGVFAGMMYHNHAAGLADVPEALDGYLGVGTASSVLSGRVAYSFGFEVRGDCGHGVFVVACGVAPGGAGAAVGSVTWRWPAASP